VGDSLGKLLKQGEKMAAFTVRVAGLMVHVAISDTDDEVEFKHLGLLDERTHHDSPTMLIAGRDLDPPDAVPFVYKFNKYDVVTFEEVEKGHAEADPRFLNGVPGLRRCINNAGDLDQDIKDRKRHSNIQAYVDYRSGKLGVVRNFSIQACYHFPDKPPVIKRRCVPSIVEYVADDKDQRVTVRVRQVKADGKLSDAIVEQPVRSGASVVIVNLTGHAGAKHFEHYKRLTDAPEVALVKAGMDCPSLPTGGKEGFLNALSDGDAQLKEELEKLIPKPKEAMDRTGNIGPLAIEPDPECSNTKWP
jgi:hypothetical protein